MAFSKTFQRKQRAARKRTAERMRAQGLDPNSRTDYAKYITDLCNRLLKEKPDAK